MNQAPPPDAAEIVAHNRELRRMIDEQNKTIKKLEIERDKAMMQRAEANAEIGRLRSLLNKAVKAVPCS